MRPDDEIVQDMANSLANIASAMLGVERALEALCEQIDRSAKRIDEKLYQLAQATRENGRS